MTPMHEVSLEDVLAAKHLPPLSLKDFEEYLLFEEHSVENLYFTVWLKDYSSRYNCILANDPTTITPSYLSHSDVRRIPGKSPNHPDVLFSSSLALSFTRAKRTFFHHTSPLELNLNSSILTNLLLETRGVPHPPPQVFEEVEKAAMSMMRQSLQRFVAARYGNVGTSRAVCGIIAGLVIMGFGLIPIFTSIFDRRSRLLRLAALPCFWFGATVFLSAVRGICLGIYFFGDARQLYSFELARPPISYPVSSRSVSDVESTIHNPEDTKQAPPQLSLTRSISVESAPESELARGDSQPPSGSIVEVKVYNNGSRSSAEFSPTLRSSDQPTFSTTHPPSNLDTITVSPVQFHRRFVPPETAAFIPSFFVRPVTASTTSFSPAAAYAYTYVQQPADFQPQSPYYQTPSAFPGPMPRPLVQPLAFDFEALPDLNIMYEGSTRGTTLSRSMSLGASEVNPLRSLFPPAKSKSKPSSSWLIFPFTNKSSTHPPSNPSTTCPNFHPDDEVIIGSTRDSLSQAHPHRHPMPRVPAFGPLTKILNPVVLRYQWLIVMQSALMAALLSASLLGIAIAIPGPW